MNLKVTVLGCGNSTGVPAIGNVWGACDPGEPKNRRSRASIAVQSAGTTIIIDTGPDFREQVNRTEIKTINAVLYTHAHGDHMNGIDELRIITSRNKKRTPIYGNSWSIEEMRRNFKYIFDGANHELYPPIVEPHVIEPAQYGQKLTVGDIDVVPFEQNHGTCKTLGYRFGNFGYSTDMWRLDDYAVDTLKGIETWIVDAAGYKQTDNKVHANLETIYELNRRIGAKQVYLTSLSLAMDYETLSRELPPGYAPAHDGLKLNIIP